MDDATLIKDLTGLAFCAGEAVMSVYDDMPEAKFKADASPVTAADEVAEKIILAGLEKCAADIAVISEEREDGHGLAAPERFFLVDPLDGTKELLRRDGTFTINIALVKCGLPVLGVVYAPALGRMFTGAVGSGAEESAHGDTKPISVRKTPATGKIALTSRSHGDAQTDKWLSDNDIGQTVTIGSSLKFCLLACGEADIYPRFGPTMEWDTAAGHAVLLAAGGFVTTPEGGPFVYGKPQFRNGPFIAGTDKA